MYSNRTFENLDIDPRKPCPSRPGSDEKVQAMAARYQSGLPLWNELDVSHDESGGNDVRRELFGSTLPIVPSGLDGQGEDLDETDPGW